MSFESMKVAELREVVRGFVGEQEAKDARGKQDMLSLLAEEGVTYQQYNAFKEAEHDDPKESLDLGALSTHKKVKKEEMQQSDEVVVKMDRRNLRFDILGFTFTREHPYAVMSPDLAQQIFDQVEGFRIANPKEVADYYS